MKKQILTLTAGLSCSLVLTGCATLFGGGSNQAINIKSQKETVVDVYKVEPIKKDSANNNDLAAEKKEQKEPKLIHANITVPSSINVDRNSDDILLKPKNSDCAETRVEKKLNPWFWGDVVATSLLSTTVDAVTGAMWEYDKDVTLECQN